MKHYHDRQEYVQIEALREMGVLDVELESGTEAAEALAGGTAEPGNIPYVQK